MTSLWYVIGGDTFQEADLTAMLGAVNTDYPGLVGDQLDESIILESGSAQAYDFGPVVGGLFTLVPATQEVTLELNHAGSRTGDPLPPDLSMCVTYRSGLGGRSRRGRGYWPPPQEDVVQDSGFLTGAYLTAFLSGVSQLATNIGAAATPDADQVVVSRKLGQTTVVTSRTMDGRVDGQRRRRSKVA